MNIKRRLFVSNLLMIVIPLLLSLTIFFGGLHLYAMIAGLGEERRGRGELSFVEAVEKVEALAEKWRSASAGVSEMTEDVEQFNRRHSGGRLSLKLYGNGVPLAVTASEDSPLAEQALQQEDSVTLFSRTAIHAQQVGDYRVVLRTRNRFIKASPNYRKVMSNGALVSLICSVFIVLLTSRFLTQFVFKKILYAMDTLIDGVHQVRDGNLSFRIHYGESDEFSAVCQDFNEMAARLLDSVSARQKDEQSRKELIAGISHDLRTPLTSIKAYVEGLEQGVASTPEARRRYVDTIKKKTNDLEHTIDTLFLFSKLDAGECPYRMEQVNLREVAAEVVEGLAGEYAGRGLDISLSPDSPQTPVRVRVHVDPMQMHYVMINVFENSVKYKERERAKMTVAVSESGGNVTLTLTDDGPGAPEEMLPKLFDVFYRGDPSRNNPSKGSGLGLAIAAKIVRHFGGTVEAVNVPGGGLSIVMSFPGLCPVTRSRDKSLENPV